MTIKDYFNHLAPNWDNMHRPDKEKIKTILNITNVPINGLILDIGTGTGILIDFLMKYQPRKLVAIDTSEEMIKIASNKFNYKNLELLNKDFLSGNFKGFDYSICYSAYPHFLDKDLFIRTLYNSLKDNGRFVLAHSESKEVINKRHQTINQKNISITLKDINQEAKAFRENFNIDIMVDTSEYYILSGIKKAD